MEVKSVSTEQYLAKMDGGVYVHFEDVPEEYRLDIELGRDRTGTYDYVGMLQRRKDWVVEPLKELQPYSYRAFQEAVGPLLLGVVLIKNLIRPEDPPLVRPIMFFDATGRMIEVFPTFLGGSYEDGHDTVRGTLQSLPAALARSWLWRTNGWRMPSEPFQGPLINRRLVCHPMQGWASIEDVLKTYDPKRWKWMMNTILKRFPDAVVTHYHPDDGSPSEWTQMRCFLDTRPPGVSGPVGDQFFVFDEHRDQTVYHIHRGDIDNIRILRDPADAIDRYCAHTLRRHPGEFDFSPWSEPL
ncbi:hypothetical protein EDC50_2430 [Vulcaniibacterium tengchongense]|uniref:Uncharacterized protein n=2 Tax=Vulcaniibacterium tengchongense TaxID=1273429 RepID=A0A3N4VC20_9GAMM|nr:hypothetical protein EDC50_2430 [Vulcaniibacterium tengchongense]